MDVAIELRGVTRTFGDVVALDDVELALPRGRITGLLGHNGAGKTTLVRVLNGLLTPDRGVASVLGHDPELEGAELRRRTGVVSETAGLDDLLTVREILDLRAQIAGLPRPAARRRGHDVLNELGLADLTARRIRGLSSGQRQRVALARALLTEPELLFLDEPTSNMDPVASRQVYDLMRRQRDTGGTVILCTHELQEAARVCDQIVILERGRVMAVGSPRDVTVSAGLQSELLVRSTPAGADRMLMKLNGEWSSRRIRRLDSTSIELSPLTSEEVPRLVAWMVDQGIPVAAVVPRSPTLEDAYLALHGAPAGGSVS